MIGELYTMNGLRTKLVEEESAGSCLGCCFSEVDEDDCHNECLFHSKEGESLECGNVNGIYKKLDLKKGLKKKINLN